MEKWRFSITWLLGAALAFALALWLFPRVFHVPEGWETNRDEAIEIALENFERLGEPIDDPYIVTQFDVSYAREKQLRSSGPSSDLENVPESLLKERLLGWRVTVYESGAQSQHWTYRATVSASGALTELMLQVPEQEAAEAISPEEARSQADAFLRELGFDLSLYGEPILRRNDLEARTDLSLHYPDRRALLGEDVPNGLDVVFAGDRLGGFGPWVENPALEELLASLQPMQALSVFWILMPLFVFPFVGYFFLRRYHAGEVGVRRAIHVFAVAFGAGTASLMLSARGATESFMAFGIARELLTLVWAAQIITFWVAALALAAALSWTVGESQCRETWGQKLAAFDAFFRRRWQNATVARSALRGFAGAMGLSAALLAVMMALHAAFGAETGISLLIGPWWQEAPWPGLTMVLFLVPLRLQTELFAWLFLLPMAVRRFGTPAGSLAVIVVSTFIFWPPVTPDPALWFVAINVVRAVVLCVLFLRYDLLTTLIAGIGSSLFLTSMLFLFAEDPSLVFQGVFPILVTAVPLLLSFRYLASDREFVYRYEDVPAHVRRIAERERQRVELETARQIQSSILPELPPRLAGIDLAYVYLPATEVGGDFYDVMALEDGRLAVAVGDVAGHGVSSGLIMSMAKSTLALQVTVDPEVSTVLHTLNRAVYQSARLRLLTTLCYALVDRDRHELVYGCAGHLAPYRIDTQGRVEPLVASSYPLGVRDSVEIDVRTTKLEPGDRIFLYSDGVVEARREIDDELFGFERLEDSLRRHAEEDPGGLRDGVLSDIESFTAGTPREDDQTILVLRVP